MKWHHPYAKHLRHHATDAEHLLWYYLRAKRFFGFKFRRQHPVDHFVVDFCCLERRLIIELDGGQHATQVEADQCRSTILETYGFRVLRFWNEDLLKKPEMVMTMILEALGPLPDPLPRAAGEGDLTAPSPHLGGGSGRGGVK